MARHPQKSRAKSIHSGPVRPVLARILQRLQAVQKPEQRASLEAGLGPDAIRDMRRKPKIMPRIDTIAALAPVLGTSPEWLAFEAGSETPSAKRSPQGVRILGDVAAGLWLEVGAIDEAEVTELPVGASPRYPAGAQFALRVKGTSINRVARPDDLLLCVDIVKGGVEPADGDLVIVQRQRNDGAETEVTAKRIGHRGRMIHLIPDSDDERWQEPLILDPGKARDGEEITIIAIVTGVYRPIARSQR